MSEEQQLVNIGVNEVEDEDSSFASDKMEAIDEMDGGFGGGELDSGSRISQQQVYDKKMASHEIAAQVGSSG